MNEGNLLPELKRSEVLPLFKENEPIKKENHGEPVNLLPHILKVFERILYKQINMYTENKLSNL